MAIPGRKSVKLNQAKSGTYGEFGHGANVEVRFIQGIIKHDWLDNIKLIEEIEGSDRWDVRDLFQRNVDHQRVGDSLLPYLKDDTKVKFFAPLTLVLLPMKNQEVVGDLEIAVQSEETMEGDNYTSIELPEYFKFLKHDSPEYSLVNWSSENVKLVAVDGQHRLTALKRWKDENDLGMLEHMDIPVVIVGFFKATETESSPTLLEVVRKTFVYINSKAQSINESRRILLDDEDIWSVCTQEIVQYAHTNDQKDSISLNQSAMPLMMIDWRGEERKSAHILSPSALFSVKDIYDWLNQFILPGEKNNFEKKAIPRLKLDLQIPEFSSENFPLSHADSETVREAFKSDLMGSMLAVIEGMDPFQKYIQSVREIQERSEAQTGDVGKIAFKWLCFGKNSSHMINTLGIDEQYAVLTQELTQAKETHIEYLLTLDIGLRAVWSAFSILKDETDRFQKRSSDWLVFSQLFLGPLNKIYRDGWFGQYEVFDSDKKNFMHHIAYSLGGGIVNYRSSDVLKGYGALLSVLVAKEFMDGKLLSAVWNNQKDSLLSTYKKGAKKHIKIDMNNNFVGTPVAALAELNRRTNEEAQSWVNKLESYLEKDT